MGTAGFELGIAISVAKFNVYHDTVTCKVFTESGVPIADEVFDDRGF